MPVELLDKRPAGMGSDTFFHGGVLSFGDYLTINILPHVCRQVNIKLRVYKSRISGVHIPVRGFISDFHFHLSVSGFSQARRYALSSCRHSARRLPACLRTRDETDRVNRNFRINCTPVLRRPSTAGLPDRLRYQNTRSSIHCHHLPRARFRTRAARARRRSG